MEIHVCVFATFASDGAHFVFLPPIKPFIPSISIMSLSDSSSSSSVNPGINNRVAGTAFDPHHADHDPDAPGNFIDNYNLDCEGGDDYTLSQKMVHYCGGIILSEHWAACKAVLCFQAGASTSKLNSMTKLVKEAACLELYKASNAALDPLNFCDGSRAFFLRSFRKKDEPVSAEHLYRYYLDSRLKMRNLIIPFFPKDLVTMKSGKGFHESCNAVYVKAYRQEMAKSTHRGAPKYTPLQVDSIFPPPMWEYTKMPWFLGLAVKIFRRDPQLAPNVADVLGDVSNLPVSRAELKRRKQVELLAEKRRKESPASDGTSGVGATAGYSTPRGGDDNSNSVHGCHVVAAGVNPRVTATANAAVEKKILWAKVLTSKSIAENTNIAKRMGKMEELEKGMSLLDKMRRVIGEEAYVAKVQAVLAAFPAFDTFHTEVDVIKIVDDDDDAVNDSRSGTEPNLSNMQVVGATLFPRIIHMNLPPDIDEIGDDVVNEQESVVEATNE